MPDKWPGTVAGQAAVVRAVSPCQRESINAGQSGKRLNRRTLYRAEAFILGRKLGVRQTTNRNLA